MSLTPRSDKKCEGCRAYTPLYDNCCELGYEYKETKHYFENILVRRHRPLEKCPKPTTLSRYMECIKANKLLNDLKEDTKK